MAKTFKQQYLKLLVREKERIFKTLGNLQDDVVREAKTESGGVPTHIADLGTDAFEKNLEIDLSSSEGRILQLINEAIDKLETGKFGVCESCRKRIPPSRLKALPYAKFCIDCQREKERNGE